MILDIKHLSGQTQVPAGEPVCQADQFGAPVVSN